MLVTCSSPSGTQGARVNVMVPTVARHPRSLRFENAKHRSTQAYATKNIYDFKRETLRTLLFQQQQLGRQQRQERRLEASEIAGVWSSD